MKKAGFIGLGHLGGAMAKRLISEGIDLVVWNRTVQKAKDLARTLRVPLSTGAIAKEIFALAFRENKEPLDMSVVYEVLKAGYG